MSNAEYLEKEMQEINELMRLVNKNLDRIINEEMNKPKILEEFFNENTNGTFSSK